MPTLDSPTIIDNEPVVEQPSPTETPDIESMNSYDLRERYRELAFRYRQIIEIALPDVDQSKPRIAKKETQALDAELVEVGTEMVKIRDQLGGNV